MIREENGLFILESNNTSYLFRVMETGHLEHLYYGAKIPLRMEKEDSVNALTQKRSNGYGCSIAYTQENVAIAMDEIRLEISGRGKGDMRQPMLELVWADGSRSVDFVYESHTILEGKNTLQTLPSSYDETGEAKTLVVTLKEKYQEVRLDLYYSVFEECDAIVRNAVLRNDSQTDIRVERLFSAQLDVEGCGYDLITFQGQWAREMQMKRTSVISGTVVNGSRSGVSSNLANPFVMLATPGTCEDYGECIGCNLIYSGNHYEAVDVSGQNKSRLAVGIHPEGFEWILKPGEKLETPEAVFAFSESGFSGISKSMHAFVREHIVRGEWKRKPRPVLLNSWEAAYFDFNESKLLKLAKAGKEVGIELFVMDDGWFGKRNDDSSSLGDWYVNTKKLPGGIKSIADKVEELGMSFGLWVEPEMINEDSDLYRAHPDWAVKIPGRAHSEGRNQMLLDLSRVEIQDYIIERMTEVFGSGKVSYVKWDMNRNFSDFFSQALPADRQGEFSHRYMMGLYRVMDTLVKAFPHILFEGCASGGNRFDLGILCYMPQIWSSDNTDAISRTYIQNGYSYGYPQSVMGAHVSNCPNHQTLRVTPLETRFAVAAFGVFGYECNLCEMNKEELAAIKEQITLYKKWREVLQFGDFYRLGGKLSGVNAKFGTGGRSQGELALFGRGGNLAEWMVVSKDGEKAVGMMIQETVSPHLHHLVFRTKGLREDKRYRFSGRTLKYNIMRFGDLINMISPIHIKQDSLIHNAVAKFIKMDGEKEECVVSGGLLNHAGIELAQGFAGTGYGENTRLYQDFDARLYFMESVE